MAYSFDDLKQAYEMMSNEGEGSKVWLSRKAVSDLLEASGINKQPQIVQMMLFSTDLLVATEDSVYILREGVLEQIPFKPFAATAAA